MTSTTKSGFKFEVKESVLSDWRYFKFMRYIDRNELQYIVDAIEFVLGEQQVARLEKHIEKLNNGVVSIESIAQEFTEICQLCNALKK